MLVLKDVLGPRLKPISSGGGRKSSNQTSTLQTESNPYPSHLVILDILSLWSVLYSARHWCKNYT